LICLDTCVVIWGVQGAAHPGQEGMIGRTRRYLAGLSKDGVRIMIPAVVVGEYLEGFPPEEQGRHLAVLKANFFLPAFDAKCAEIASQLRAAASRQTSVSPGMRRAAKADAQIIATAIAHNAELIVTGNLTEYRRLSNGRIKVSDVPDVWEQPDLLTQAEKRP